MRLKLKTREDRGTRGDLRKIRFEGGIPAIVYLSGKPGERGIVDGAEFSAILRNLPQGRLPTLVFELDWKGEVQRAIVKAIQYHPTTYAVLHLDFQLLSEGSLVDIKVPVTLVGGGECAGVKMGGFVRKILHHVKVRCASHSLPTDFSLGIHELKIGEVKRVRDIRIEEGITPLTSGEEIVVLIAKR